MSRPTLTDRQRGILDFIYRMVKQLGYPPTMRQIGKEFGIRSTNGVRAHLRALQKKEYIKRNAYTSRGIELLGAGLRNALNTEVLEIPVISRVAAGTPLLAVENIDDTLVLNRDLIKGEGLFALRIQGDSMIEAGILDGDYVLVCPQATADNGTIVVALLGEEATVKTFFCEPDGRIRLQPANARLEPILTNNVQIVGQVVGLLRTAFH
ncbi:MAG: transcriptional repressor LexA [Acidobacteria bacterium]|nr:transcriptional repressor LexA [Acidobacteriota bacterium]MBI3655524.1 transcriptional repressor LexA [Acidobacteriota bacterium]